MTDLVRNILSAAGLADKAVQVFEMEHSKTATLLYPNFFTAKDEKIKGATEEHLIDVIIELVSTHIEEVKRDLDLLNRAKKEYYAVD
jgi:putative lipoic acid-binding regulatory protein